MGVSAISFHAGLAQQGTGFTLSPVLLGTGSALRRQGNPGQYGDHCGSLAGHSSGKAAIEHLTAAFMAW